ncbi:MAG: sensor histidine kinase [Fimbriimonadaceae bacterium]
MNQIEVALGSNDPGSKRRQSSDDLTRVTAMTRERTPAPDKGFSNERGVGGRPARSHMIPAHLTASGTENRPRRGRTRELLNRQLKLRATQLETANGELEAFSYSVSHDLRAPLRAINGCAHILETELSGGLTAPNHQALRRIITGSETMSDIIEALLDLAKGSGEAIGRQEVDLSAMAREIGADLAAQSLPATTLEVEEGLTALCNAKLVRIVLFNLLSNAFKFSARSKRREVFVSQNACLSEKVFSVRDTGAGFDPKRASSLFAPFQRLHRSEEFPGTGVGLATCQKIIKRHGGQIWADGSVGRGATFYFTLSAETAAC